MSTRLRVLCALTMLLALSAGAAQAHAYVVGAQPPMGGSNQRLIAQITISFDEPVDVLDSDAVQVFDGYGARIDRRDAAVDRGDATRVVVHVPRNLKPGVYTVRWRVVSADTHVVHGVYRIGIGVPVSEALVPESGSPFDPSAALPLFLRWLSLMGALLAGGAVFLRWYALDRLERDYPGGIAVARLGAIAGTVVLLVAAIPSLIVQASATRGVLGGDIVATLTHTTWGVAFSVRIFAAVVLLLAALFAWPALTRIMIVPVVILLASFSAAGHALSQASFSARIVAAAADFAHLAAAAAWIGSVFVITAMLPPKFGRSDAKRRDRMQALFAAFSPLAVACAGIVVATGTYAATLHIANAGNLVASAYGRVLIAKICVVGVLLWLGWRHLRFATGASSRVGTGTLGYETLAGASVVALTAALIGQAPPDHRSALPTSTPVALAAILCILVLARVAALARGFAVGRLPPRVARAFGYLDGLIVVAFVLLFLEVFVVRTFCVREVSMFPTVWSGDEVLVDETAYYQHPPRTGEIAIFSPPIKFGGDDLIQRVIGVPGDTITILNGTIYRNGVALREPYKHQPPSYDLAIRDYSIFVDAQPLDPQVANVPPRAFWQAPNRIPRGFYFMLGDNRNYSVDSHFFGFAQTGGAFAAGPLAAQKTRASFAGKAVLAIWPLSRLRILAPLQGSTR